MKLSIRTKIFIMVIGFTSFIVFSSWYICNVLFEKVFVHNLKYNLVLTYQSCNELFEKTGFSDAQNGDLYGKIDNPTEAMVLILDRMEGKIYTSINDESQMMDNLRNIIKSVEESDVASNKAIPGSYEITKHHDGLLNTDYYDLVGVLDNGFIVIIRSPLAQIEGTLEIVTKMFNEIVVGLLVFSSIFIVGLSTFITAPLKRLSHAAKQMSNLEFDVKVPVYSKDELGELAESMNDMSYKLEYTISELKSANAALQKDIEKKEQIDDMRKEFLSHVSHELKTPIALVQGYAEGLKDNLFDDDESKEYYTDVIIDEAQKMNTLVKKLLNLNELEFGNTQLSIERFELVGFIRDVINAHEILIKEANARVEFQEIGPLYVWADEYMIEEVFTNYLTNAIHYVNDGGVIRIFFKHEIPGTVRVCVFNQGPNISDEDIDKLFVKFYKADKARTREYGGSGIGLSIVAATMKSHGKQYGVYNEPDGVVFYFDLDANLLEDKAN